MSDGDDKSDWGKEVEKTMVFDWDTDSKKTLGQLISELDDNALFHMRLKNEDGEIAYVIVLASGRPAARLNQVVTEEFSPAPPTGNQRN